MKGRERGRKSVHERKRERKKCGRREGERKKCGRREGGRGEERGHHTIKTAGVIMLPRR